MIITISNINNLVRFYRGSFVTSQHIIMLALIFMLSGCKKSDEPDKSELLRGIWINTHTNETVVQTNIKFVMEFSINTEYYSAGVIIDSFNKKWIPRRAYDFTLSGESILIFGTDVKNNQIEIVFGIISLSSTELICCVNQFKMNGVQIHDPKIYNFRKVNKDLSQKITGTWYGKATYEGSADTDYHYWNYLPDGTYEYYYREDPSTQQWIKKNDNEGRYYMYDNLLATNWSNDIFTGNPGLDYECWEIEIIGDAMKWTGYRANGHITSYEMVKVSGPPALY